MNKILDSLNNFRDNHKFNSKIYKLHKLIKVNFNNLNKIMFNKHKNILMEIINKITKKNNKNNNNKKNHFMVKMLSNLKFILKNSFNKIKVNSINIIKTKKIKKKKINKIMINMKIHFKNK